MSEIFTAFQEALATGAPLKIHWEDGTPAHLVPLPSSPDALQCFHVEEGAIRPFRVNEIKDATRCERVQSVQVRDNVGNFVRSLPPNLSGCAVEFEVWGAPSADRYRVDVTFTPSPAAYGGNLFEEALHADSPHLEPVQHFKIHLQGSANGSYRLSIIRVDEATYARDPENAGNLEWKDDFPVRQV